MLRKLLNPQNDFAFKKIFGSEKNKDIVLALLNTVLKKQLHRPIKQASFIPRVQDPETAAKKASSVDLMCKDQDGCLYIIEMQVVKYEGYRERAQYYASKAYINQSVKGGKYSKLEKVIFLAFINYSLFPNKKDHKSNHQILDIVTHEQDFDRLAFTIVDLVKFNKQNEKKVSDLNLEEKFYYFLSHAHDISPEDLEAIIKGDPIIDKAFKSLSSYYWTEEELEKYENEEKQDWDYRSGLLQSQEEGIEKGRKEGREEGREEGRREGREEGMQEGEKKGREEGMQEGRKEGREEGRQEGRKEGREEGMQEGEKKGREEGMQEGKKKGREEGRQETILELIKKGIITKDQADKL